MKAKKHIYSKLTNLILIGITGFSSLSFSQTCGDLPIYSMETAQKVYEVAISPSFGLDYKNAENGCYERADKIHDEILARSNIKSLQAFIQIESGDCGATGASCLGQSDSPKISYQSIYSSNTYYEWDFHTAPVICVHNNNRSELYVIDPSTATRPISLSTWVQNLSYGLQKEGFSTFTRPF